MQHPPGSWPPVLKYKDLNALRIPELVLKPRDIPIKRMEMEETNGNQAGLALKSPDDRLPIDSRKRGFLDERLRCSEDLDQILECEESREGNRVVANAHKGENLWQDEF